MNCVPIRGGEHSRSSTERRLMRLLTNSRERIRDHSHEENDQPKIEDDDADDEEDAGHEELGLDHAVHQRRHYHHRKDTIKIATKTLNKEGKSKEQVSLGNSVGGKCIGDSPHSRTRGRRPATPNYILYRSSPRPNTDSC